MIPVHLSAKDLDLAEQACRMLVERYRRDAMKQTNPVIQGTSHKLADDFERLADRLLRLRQSGKARLLERRKSEKNPGSE